MNHSGCNNTIQRLIMVCSQPLHIFRQDHKHNSVIYLSYQLSVLPPRSLAAVREQFPASNSHNPVFIFRSDMPPWQMYRDFPHSFQANAKTLSEITPRPRTFTSQNSTMPNDPPIRQNCSNTLNGPKIKLYCYTPGYIFRSPGSWDSKNF